MVLMYILQSLVGVKDGEKIPLILLERPVGEECDVVKHTNVLVNTQIGHRGSYKHGNIDTGFDYEDYASGWNGRLDINTKARRGYA